MQNAVTKSAVYQVCICISIVYPEPNIWSNPALPTHFLPAVLPAWSAEPQLGLSSDTDQYDCEIVRYGP